MVLDLKCNKNRASKKLISFSTGLLFEVKVNFLRTIVKYN